MKEISRDKSLSSQAIFETTDVDRSTLETRNPEILTAEAFSKIFKGEMSKQE